jgi:prepilin-type N-terminal cleavage/methylation domain-containing protein
MYRFLLSYKNTYFIKLLYFLFIYAKIRQNPPSKYCIILLSIFKEDGGTFMKENLHRQRGFTLIEVLASIVILSIILISFMSFFTNSFRFNSFSSDKMEATNIARETQEKLKVNEDMKVELEDLINQAKVKVGPYTFLKSSFPKLDVNQDIQLDNTGILKLILSNPNYQVFVFVNTVPVLDSTNPLKTPLYQLQVQVLDSVKVLSQTFTYVEF